MMVSVSDHKSQWCKFFWALCFAVIMKSKDFWNCCSHERIIMHIKMSFLQRGLVGSALMKAIKCCIF